MEEKQKDVSEERYRFFFLVRTGHVAGFSNGTPLFLSRKNGRRSNVNLPLAYGGGTGCSREHACPSAHAQRHTRVCRFSARVGDAVARDTTVTRSDWQRGSTRKRG